MMNQVERNDWPDTSTSVLLYSFLQHSRDCTFVSDLNCLKNELLVSRISDDDDDDELQTDGNRCGRFQAREEVPDEEIFRIIGAQLAEIGDKLTAEIETSVIQNLAQHFRRENMSKEVMTMQISHVVQELVRKMPLDMEKEKAMLVISMALAKKVVNSVPSLLQQVFNATVNYINQNLHDYVNNLAPES
ncbi:BH3-interacting domain death agonist [Anolis carolinensis]|uniref:BH3-interacting domain death agonist n=1 Tax=Anolis carolinensis TaxID=28377 RepID=UPI00020394C8|nr:PREDICTED: BH3-interacting domain death agonist [Anolis carolinensis]|eukprot:XP_016849107.1 PREDICTED: BH3-interacting domain death agonist [Anolis carolinensis]